MACKDGFCQEEGDGDSDVPRVYPDPLLLFLFGDCLVSLHSVSVRGAEQASSAERLNSPWINLSFLFPF